MYSAGDNVVQLTSANFDKLVIQSDDVWVVEFYANCKSFTCQGLKMNPQLGFKKFCNLLSFENKIQSKFVPLKSFNEDVISKQI